MKQLRQEWNTTEACLKNKTLRRMAVLTCNVQHLPGLKERLIVEHVVIRKGGALQGATGIPTIKLQDDVVHMRHRVHCDYLHCPDKSVQLQ